MGQSKATVIKCVRLQLKHATSFKPSPALLIHPLSAPSPSLYHSLPACDPCRRHHHNKAVSCCSDFGCFGTQTARATFVCLPSIFTIILTHTNTCKTNIDFHCLHMKIFEHFYCFTLFLCSDFFLASFLVSIASFRRTRRTFPFLVFKCTFGVLLVTVIRYSKNRIIYLLSKYIYFDYLFIYTYIYRLF